MGKLPIISASGTTRDSARTHGGEEKSATTTTTTTITTATVIFGGALARSSATSGAIAGSAAADRDRRFFIASIRERASRGECATPREFPAAEVRSPISEIVDAPRPTDVARRKRRDVATGVVAITQRLRRNTWHAEGESENHEIARGVDPSESRTTSNIIHNNIEGIAECRNDRIAGDDRRTCCAAIDVAAFLATRRRARDRSIRDDITVRSSFIERRNRRAGGSSLVRSKSVAEVEKTRSTVDSITIEREDRDRFPEIPLVGTTDVIDCHGCILYNGTVNNASGHADVDARGSSILQIRESIGSGVDTRSNSGAGEPARLLEIDIVESSCEERPPCILAEALIRRRSTSSPLRFPAKIDPGGRARRSKTDTRWRLPRIGLVLRSLLLGLLAMSLLCDAVLAAPPSSSSALEMFEDDVEEAEPARNNLGDDELEIIRRSIVQGLGLQRIPDPSKANVSQAEYERAHREYLKQVQLSHDGQESRTRRSLHVFQTAEHPGNRSDPDVGWIGGDHRHSLYFPVAVPSDVAADVTVDHASLRFLLQGDHRRPRNLEALVYLRTPVSRRLLLRRGIPQGEPTGSRWLELDSTEAAAGWLERDLENHGLELEFLHDGRPTRREITHTTLNVFTASEPSGRRKRSTPEELMPLHKGRRSKCKGDNNKKCCRHELTVMFKDLKGFEFIVYPKEFDAGYCKGRCPPRYNPAHHHALLQSLLWKEDRKRVPKPCCAPSKLDQLMIVYFDENDSTQLKVSYWKNIQVLECACS